MNPQLDTPTPSLQDMASTMGLVLPPSDPAAITASTPDGSLGLSASGETDESSMLDLDEFIDSDPDLNPEDHRSRPALYNSGMAKAGLVGTVGLVVCLGGASVFKLATPETQVRSKPVKDDAIPEDPRQAQLHQAQSAASRSQAQLALQTQQQEMARLLEGEFSEGEAPAPEAESAQDKRSALPQEVVVKPRPTPSPVKLAQSPPPPLARKPIARSPIASPQPIAPPVARAQPLFSDSRPAVTPDPMAEWQRLATAGRYGTVAAEPQRSTPSLLEQPPLAPDSTGQGQRNSTTTVADTSTLPGRIRPQPAVQVSLRPTPSSTSAQPPQQASSQQPVQPSSQTLRPQPQVASLFPAAPGFGNGSGNVYQPRLSRSLASPQKPVATTVSTASSSSSTAIPTGSAGNPPPAVMDSEVSYDVDATLADEWQEFEAPASSPDHVVQPAVTRTLPVGTSALGETMMPILWAPNGMGQDAHFAIQLTEPLLDQQGQSAIPEGSQLLVQTRDHDPETGLAELEVMSIQIGGQAFTLPAGSLVIRDHQGGLLMGQDFYGNRAGAAGGDFWRIAAGALGRAGTLLNQPQRTSRSSISTTGGSSASETIELGSPNYLGAAMEGGFEVLSDVMERRQQAAARELAQAPKLYHLPAGHRIRVFVNRSLAF